METKTNDEKVEDLTLLTGYMREYKDETGSSGNPDQFIKDTLLNLMVAGRDTTSSILTSFFYLLAKNPVAESKIREEIREQLGMKEGEEWKLFGANELGNLILCQAVTESIQGPKYCYINIMGRMETIWGQDCLEFKQERLISLKGGIKHVPSYNFTALISCRAKNMRRLFELGSVTDLQSIFQRLTFDGTMSLLLDIDPETLTVELPHSKFAVLNRLKVGNKKHLVDAFKLSDELFYKFKLAKREKETKTNDEKVEDLTLLTGYMREYKDETGSSCNPDKFIKDTLLNLMVAESKIREQLGMKEGEEWKQFGANELGNLVYLHAAL
ncbi:cytochrome P450 [Artemisia annua]|uniref:Cytochrome P450 n=1 Tax=Artemisia annua TaxID=35608 RepID=A0A2U1NN23_ARTAN|nr:cytochrome P450 [Artemisia annua]